MNWGVIFYDGLWAYYEQNKRKRTISEKNFAKLVIPMREFAKRNSARYSATSIMSFFESDG